MMLAVKAFFAKMSGYIYAAGAVVMGVLFAMLKIKDAQKACVRVFFQIVKYNNINVFR